MGHDLPRGLWPSIADELRALASGAATAQGPPPARPLDADGRTLAPCGSTGATGATGAGSAGRARAVT
ncbi:hypothetical protein ACFQ0B_60835 [Nonomuraea thailandensis]